MKKKKIAHVTSVHPYDDIRIFHKECKSLSKKYEVHLFNKDFSGKIDNIIFHKVPFLSNKLLRILSSWLIALIATSFKNFKVIHFHDPELLFATPFWKLSGKKIIYDVHENYHKQFSSRTNLNFILKNLIIIMIKIIEKTFTIFTNIVIFVIDDLNDSLAKKGGYITISNHPIINYQLSPTKRKRQFVYLGKLSEQRGILKIAKILHRNNTKLVLAGNFASNDFKNKILKYPNVDYLGIIDRKEIEEVTTESIAGFCTLLPTPNHLNSSPNKFFEYLSYGTPVIASNFEKWVNFIPKTEEFIFYVDPQDNTEIELAIKNLLSKNDNQINYFGALGYNYVKKNFDWDYQEKKLLLCYEKIFN